MSDPTMSWFQSRRFYVGLLIGLAPLLLLALLALVTPDRDDGDTQRVVVRNYSDCIPDSLAAARTAGLIDALPADAILVETFPTCHGEGRGDRVTEMHASGTGRSSCLVSGQPLAVPEALPELPPDEAVPLAFAPIDPIGAHAAEGRLPGGVMYPEPGPRRAWLGLLLAPLVGFVGLFDNDGRFPDDIICPGDTGPPTGEHRPRC